MDPARHRNYETILPLIYMAKGDGKRLKWSKNRIYRPHSRYLGYMAAIYGHAGNDEMRSPVCNVSCTASKSPPCQIMRK